MTHPNDVQAEELRRIRDAFAGDDGPSKKLALRKAHDIIARASISPPIEAVAGLCPKCAGTGKGSGTAVACLRCEGTGAIVLTHPAPIDGRGEAWRYEIQHGPDGETNYAWVYDDHGVMVGTMRTHHAIAIVALTHPAPAPGPAGEAGDLIEPVAEAWKVTFNGGRTWHLENIKPTIGQYYTLVPASALAAYQEDRNLWKADSATAWKACEIRRREVVEAEARAEAAESKVAALTTALEMIANMPNEDNEWHGVELYRDARDCARAALGEG